MFFKEGYIYELLQVLIRDGKNSQTQLCIDKKIQGFPSWEINGNIIIGVQPLRELAELTGFEYWKNKWKAYNFLMSDISGI